MRPHVPRGGARLLLVGVMMLACSSARAHQAIVELVTLSSPSASDEPTLPTPVTTFDVGDTYYLEVWGQIPHNPDGFGSVTVNISYDGSLTSGVSITPTTLFATLPGGTIDNPSGLIEDLTGSAPVAVPACSTAVGVAPKWGRVAIIEMKADASGATLIESGSATSLALGVAICGALGDLDPADVDFGEIALTFTSTAVCGNGIVEAGEQCDDGDDRATDFCLADCTFNLDTIVPTVSEWGLIVMAVLAFAVGTVLYRRRGLVRR